MTRFVRVAHWRSHIKQVYMFLCSPAESQERAFKDKLTKSHGATSRVDFLRELRKAYVDARDCYSDEFSIEIYETDSVGQKELAVSVLETTFTRIEAFSP
jgi:hypothetical protein